MIGFWPRMGWRARLLLTISWCPELLLYEWLWQRTVSQRISRLSTNLGLVHFATWHARSARWILSKEKVNLVCGGSLIHANVSQRRLRPKKAFGFGTTSSSKRII